MKIAVVGVTGAVGRVFLDLLEARKFPYSELMAFASPRSAGKSVVCNGKVIQVKALDEGCFDQTQIVFFDASDEISKKWVPKAIESGAWAIDSSGAFRMVPDVPLIVPEINGHLITDKVLKLLQNPSTQRLLAGPNCTTVQLVMALKPILDGWGISRLVVSTYQSVSGAGAQAIDELNRQVLNEPARLTEKAASDGAFLGNSVFPYPIAFECLPHIGRFLEDGFTSEEQKISEETPKILNTSGLKVNATAVRVPSRVGHAESVYLETERDFNLDEVRQALRTFPGVRLFDQPENLQYPLLRLASGNDEVWVGRLRKDRNFSKGLNLWIVSDNLRKGAALNAIQMGERLFQECKNHGMQGFTTP